MKKSIISVSLTLSTIPFAFYKMQNIYYKDSTVLFHGYSLSGKLESYEQPLDISKVLPVKRLDENTDDPKYTHFDVEDTTYDIFIYSPHLEYSFVCTAHYEVEEFTKRKNFFFKPTDHNSFTKPPLIFRWVKQPLDFLPLEEEGSYKPNSYNKTKNYTRAMCDEDAHVILLKKTFTVSSGITLSNKNDNTVEMIKDNKPLNFQKQLINYFNVNRYNSEFAHSIASFKEKGSDESIQKMILAANNVKKLDYHAFKLLENSTILRMYAVIKNEQGQNSVIWGLAQDNNTKQNFHWITNLEADIADLFN